MCYLGTHQRTRLFTMINSQTSQDPRQQGIESFFDLLTTDQRQSDPKFEQLKNRLQELEQKVERKFQDYERQISLLVSTTNRVVNDYVDVCSRNQELEFMVNPYSSDGDANCNF